MRRVDQKRRIDRYASRGNGQFARVIGQGQRYSGSAGHGQFVQHLVQKRAKRMLSKMRFVADELCRNAKEVAPLFAAPLGWCVHLVIFLLGLTTTFGTAFIGCLIDYTCK